MFVSVNVAWNTIHIEKWSKTWVFIPDIPQDIPYWHNAATSVNRILWDNLVHVTINGKNWSVSGDIVHILIANQ
jgi:hypothetical protein